MIRDLRKRQNVLQDQSDMIAQSLQGMRYKVKPQKQGGLDVERLAVVRNNLQPYEYDAIKESVENEIRDEIDENPHDPINIKRRLEMRQLCNYLEERLCKHLNIESKVLREPLKELFKEFNSLFDAERAEYSPVKGQMIRKHGRGKV